MFFSRETTMPRPKGSLNKKSYLTLPSSNFGDQVDEELVRWLENEENRSIIDGKQSGGAPQSGKGITKTEGFNRLAIHVNSVCGTRYNGSQMQGKFSYLKNKYKKAVAFQSSSCSGEGITESDRALGITTISEKLNLICPFYDKWEEFYGEKPNVRPRILSSSESISEVVDDVEEFEEEIAESNTIEDRNSDRVYSESERLDTENSSSKRKKKFNFTNHHKDESRTKSKTNFRDDFYQKRVLALQHRLDFEKEKFALDHEKQKKVEEIESKKLELEKEKHLYEKQKHIDDRRAQLLMKLLDLNKSPEEIEKYISLL